MPQPAQQAFLYKKNETSSIVLKEKPNAHRPIIIKRKNHYQVSQLEFNVKTSNLPKARENANGQVALGFSFLYDWLSW